jgi:hypothetical protein
MAVEGTRKGGVNFHRELIPYLDSNSPENQKWLTSPKLNASQTGRYMVPQELMRYGEVNYPSVEPS